MKILFVGANGIDTSRLRIGAEFRDVQAEIERARASGEIEILAAVAVTPVDLNRLLLEYEPDVVHFSGHGTLARTEPPPRTAREFGLPDSGSPPSSRQGRLLLETPEGEAAPVSAGSLARLFAILKTQRCVVLNACFSAAEAASIAAHVDCVIGMKGPIDDRSASVFAVGFYQAIARGKTVKAAFELGCNLIETCGLPDADMPELRGRVDPATVRLVGTGRPPAMGWRDIDSTPPLGLFVTPLSTHGSPDLYPAIPEAAPWQAETPRRAPRTDRPTWRSIALDSGARSHTTRADAERDDDVTGPPSVSSRLPASGENRVCTVMFVDLAGATRGAAKWSPERLKEICDRHYRVLEEQVEGLGGIVQRLVGDRALALFGVPRAAENDVERGVVSAMRTREAMRRLPPLRELKGARPSVRIGVATGRVFVQIEGTSSAEISVVGEATELAARLQQMAPEGAIVIGREAYRQVMGLVDVEPLPPSPLEGGDGVIAAFRVLAPTSVRPAFATADFYGFETKFVGRSAERRWIADAYETAVSEVRPQLVTLVGAPGLGRSRLLSEILTGFLSRPEPPLILLGQGSPLFRDTTYGFLASMLRRRFGAEEGDSPTRVRRRLRSGLRWFRMRTAAAERAGDWTTALGIPSDEADELEDGLRQLEVILGIHEAGATRDRFPDESSNLVKPRIRAAVSRLLRFAARRTPVVFVCNHLQWVDDASLDLFDDVLRDGADLPIFALCGTRPDLFERRPQWGADREGHQRIDLTPLPRRFIEEMIRDRLRAVPSLPPDLMKIVADRAEGSPRLAEETLHLLLDTGVIEARADKPWTVHEDRMGELTLPTTIQGIVQERIDRLGADTRIVLMRAAVVGRSFWQGALEHLSRDIVGPEGSLERHLDVLRERLLIRRRRPSSIAGEEEYVFVDSATYEVAYQMPSRKVLGPLHLLVAEWLEGKMADQSPAVVAVHYDRGGDLARAAAAYERAAHHAASLGENVEALRHLERARDIHDELGAEQELGEHVEWVVATPIVVSAADRVRVRIELGDVLRRIGRLDEAEVAYEQARERIPRDEPSAKSEIDFARALRFDARIDYRLALLQRVRGSLEAARALVERAITRATEAGAHEETPPMLAVLVFLHRRLKQPDRALEAARRGLRICRSIPNRDEPWRMNVVETLLGLAVALLGKKKLGAAERTFRQVSRMLSESAHPHQVSLALNGIAGLRLAKGDLRGAREYLLRSLRLKERAGDLHQLAIAYSNLAEVELRLSETKAAVEHAKRSVWLGEQARAGYDLADMYKNLAQASLASGDLDGALDAGSRALAIAGETGKFYLKDVASAVAQSCAQVAKKATPGSDLHTKAQGVARSLLRILNRSADDPDLGQRSMEWRSLVAPLLEQADETPVS
ncbi:tetratricopeptide repeat protein [Polyangium sp. 15x6]|uniref:tetratricopeptide repeat protein n=1 Tax=Polyangium sp. 15x6 TaxID=3042687 RepID=UPI00249ACEDE|nr:tetratricopeptide repeat protein [Polyangium sp. 15x6]MDI3289015.1 tetratricopeptide repeat protein [Polyangium sp. 15x6]